MGDTIDNCPKCDGEGFVANTERQEPWSQWSELPVQAALAVLLNIVKPIVCPLCGGTGGQITAL